MSAAMLEGHWVLLQNAHLGLAYLSEVFLLAFLVLAYLSYCPSAHPNHESAVV